MRLDSANNHTTQNKLSAITDAPIHARAVLSASNAERKTTAAVARQVNDTRIRTEERPML